MTTDSTGPADGPTLDTIEQAPRKWSRSLVAVLAVALLALVGLGGWQVRGANDAGRVQAATSQLNRLEAANPTFQGGSPFDGGLCAPGLKMVSATWGRFVTSPWVSAYGADVSLSADGGTLHLQTANGPGRVLGFVLTSANPKRYVTIRVLPTNSRYFAHTFTTRELFGTVGVDPFADVCVDPKPATHLRSYGYPSGVVVRHHNLP